uniref:Uncharacterized protein n=2 Tax=Lotharella globosa TaxID=91324 RepID=A0A6U3A1P7_9EUKA|mmetsp:Transcript_22757/g.44375  ORF Transcript_22757/g.44375 Transcript_22757/m.44375 type:complete len:133 (+) Transcript_22757:554-952(+)
MALITSIPQLTTDVQRSHPEGDLNCQKVFGVVTGILGFVTTLAAINTFVGDCQRNLTSTDPNGGHITYTFGPSLILLTLATFAKLLDVTIHLILPLPPPSEKENIELRGEESKIPKVNTAAMSPPPERVGPV